MQILSTTKMSSKGQVVIPEEIRNKLGLTSGSRFVVVGDDDVIIMKTIDQPSMRDFDTLISKARKQAKLVQMTEYDVSRAVDEVRENK